MVIKIASLNQFATLWRRLQFNSRKSYCRLRDRVHGILTWILWSVIYFIVSSQQQQKNRRIKREATAISTDCDWSIDASIFYQNICAYCVPSVDIRSMICIAFSFFFFVSLCVRVYWNQNQWNLNSSPEERLNLIWIVAVR